jgi:glycosyltransferase involved in cell wall biosynthesis
MQPELKVRKILGRTYLNENKLSEALDIFIKIMMDYPDDLETILILGGFYLAAGDGKTARDLYLRAQQLDPNNITIQRQVMLAEEMDDGGVIEPVPTDLDAVSRLLQKLTGQKNEIQENDIMRAATLLDQIVNSESPAELVSNHLDQIDDLLVALIEVNIRQAQADGRIDVAEGLRALQLNIDIQLVAKKELSESGDPIVLQGQSRVSVLMLRPDLENKSNRMSLLKSTLESSGCHVMERSGYVDGQDPTPDIVITSDPHIEPGLVDDLSSLSQMGIPILLDLNADYKRLPVSHPDYSRAGLGTQQSSDAFAKALLLADRISVPSQALADSLTVISQPVHVIPDGWSRRNKLWEKNAAPHGVVSLGWVGTSGELDDLMLIRRFIVRILREFVNTRIVIIGNPQAYRLFEGLPESRRKYIPMVAHEEYPYLLGQLDLLMVPLRNLPQNLSMSDTLLMEAGAKGVPWIASSIPAFRDWMHGGIISDTLDDWHLNLRHLVMDEDLRGKLAKAGRGSAATREMEYLGRSWMEVINQMTNTNVLSLPRMEKV